MKREKDIQKALGVVLSILISLVIYSNTASAKTIIKDYKKLIVQQTGVFTCWAATLEAVERFKGNKVNQLDIVKAITQYAYGKRMTDKEFEELRHTDKLALNTSLLNFVFVGNTVIDRSQIEEVLKSNEPVIYIANNHVSLIVGVEGKYFHTMDTSSGKIKKVKMKDIVFLERYQISKDKAIFMKVNKNPVKRSIASQK